MSEKLKRNANSKVKLNRMVKDLKIKGNSEDNEEDSDSDDFGEDGENESKRGELQSARSGRSNMGRLPSK